MKIGIDIGGTKCSVVSGDRTHIEKKIKFDTTTCEQTLEHIFSAVEEFGCGDSVGISCGGPLDSEKGIILSPPNLVGWNDVRITDMIRKRFGVPAYLCNDANACALAEWKYGAGRGAKNMVFLTFGTGLGAGIILNGKLYEGTCGTAGEIGHIRLSDYGPVGYGKRGSAEGFCSGGGLAQLGKTLALERLQNGETLPYCNTLAELDGITALSLADWARKGDKTALEAYEICGEMLGRTLSVIIDFLNPEVIVIGSIFARAEDLLRPSAEKIINREALAAARSACRIVPAETGENIGDYAALAAAYIGEE